MSVLILQGVVFYLCMAHEIFFKSLKLVESVKLSIAFEDFVPDHRK